MPKICYVNRNFSEMALNMIDVANEILEGYAQQGYDLTLRQLYYQFVARGIIANKVSEYDRLGAIINDARLAGLVDWLHIVDRTRNLRGNKHWNHPADIIEYSAEQYQTSLWDSQPNYVEVWVEKDALGGIVSAAVAPLDVPYFSCRGYTSQSEMWMAAQRIMDRMKKGKRVYIIHLGDHDPSGMDMSRDIFARLRLFCEHHLGEGARPTVRRVALNMNQVNQYNPPPNPAKVTDSRAAGYIERYGESSWELDALEPAVLVDIIRKNVIGLRDEAKWVEAIDKQERGRHVLKVIHRRWKEIMQVLQRPEEA